MAEAVAVELLEDSEMSAAALYMMCRYENQDGQQRPSYTHPSTEARIKAFQKRSV